MDVWCEAFSCMHINFKTVFQSASKHAIFHSKNEKFRTYPLRTYPPRRINSWPQFPKILNTPLSVLKMKFQVCSSKSSKVRARTRHTHRQTRPNALPHCVNLVCRSQRKCPGKRERRSCEQLYCMELRGGKGLILSFNAG